MVSEAEWASGLGLGRPKTQDQGTLSVLESLILKKLDRVDEKLDQVDKRLVRMETKMAVMETTMATKEDVQKLDVQIQRLDECVQGLDKHVNQSVQSLDKRLEARGKVFSAMIFTLIGALITTLIPRVIKLLSLFE